MAAILRWVGRGGRSKSISLRIVSVRNLVAAPVDMLLSSSSFSLRAKKRYLLLRIRLSNARIIYVRWYASNFPLKYFMGYIPFALLPPSRTQSVSKE